MGRPRYHMQNQSRRGKQLQTLKKASRKVCLLFYLPILCLFLGPSGPLGLGVAPSLGPPSNALQVRRQRLIAAARVIELKYLVPVACPIA